tara:strand:+ start:409 stop:738 length:330 start_codon:yes stop_codon:yes gene_type:complete
MAEPSLPDSSMSSSLLLQYKKRVSVSGARFPDGEVGKPSASAAAPVAGQFMGAYVGVAGGAGGGGGGGGGGGAGAGGGGGGGDGSDSGPDMTKDWNIYTITANIYSMFF